jgi:hypothetical protein
MGGIKINSEYLFLLRRKGKEKEYKLEENYIDILYYFFR